MEKTMETYKDKKIGLLKRGGVQYPVGFFQEFDLGTSLAEISRNLFSGLRTLDSTCDVIFTLEVELVGEGLAIMDRLEKASSYTIY